jgi:hypothetical protein
MTSRDLVLTGLRLRVFDPAATHTHRPGQNNEPTGFPWPVFAPPARKGLAKTRRREPAAPG